MVVFLFVFRMWVNTKMPFFFVVSQSDHLFIAYNSRGPEGSTENQIVNISKSELGTGSSRFMRISLLRMSLLRFFKTITKIWLMRYYGLFILLFRT